jgi:hypothetical protein
MPSQCPRTAGAMPAHCPRTRSEVYGRVKYTRNKELNISVAAELVLDVLKGLLGSNVPENS